MYNFFLNIWYYFVGKPKIDVYIAVKLVEPSKLKFGLMDDGKNLYQYFIEETVYFFWGDFLEGRPGRQIETYKEKILVMTRWNQVETGLGILMNNVDWNMRNDFFYTWSQDWGEDIILAVESPMTFDFIINQFMWMIAFFYIFFIFWNNYQTFTLKNKIGALNFFDIFHQTEDQYFDFYQANRKDGFNIFEDGINIVPSWSYSDYDTMSTQDHAYMDHEFMDIADMCEHPSEESDRFLDVMFDARGYVHYELFESLLDGTITHRYAHVEDRLEGKDILNGFENTSMIASFWWDPYDPARDTRHFDKYTWQFKESRERGKHPYYFFHPLEHYYGIVDPWIMLELTWDYEPWLEDNFSVVIMGDILVEEAIFSFIVADTEVEEIVDETDEENDFDYMDLEGLPLEDEELDQLVMLPLMREDELMPQYDEFGNKSARVWMPEIDWAIDIRKHIGTYDWEDWEELFDEGSDGAYSDNDAVLEDALMVSVMGNDLYLNKIGVYSGSYDINEDLYDVYVDYSTEFYLQDIVEGLLPYGRNEERLYIDESELSDNYSFVPIDRLFRHVSIWEFANSIDYMMGEFLLDVFAFSKENYDLFNVAAYQLYIIYNSMLALQVGKLPEYPIRWNNIAYYYEGYSVETHMWVNLEEIIRYLVLDMELNYKNRVYLLGYSPELFLKWNFFDNIKHFNVKVLLYLDWLIFKGAFEYSYTFILFFNVYLRGFFDMISSFFRSLYSFLRDKLFYKNIDVLLQNVGIFLSGNFYSNYLGLDLLVYDKSYTNVLFKNRCGFRLDLESLSIEESAYPSWWVRQGIFDQDFYNLQKDMFDPRDPLSWWYDRAEVMTYPDMDLAGCGNIDMTEDLVSSEYLSRTRNYDPRLATGFALNLKYYDYVISEGLYERDPSQWAN
jgi:hypothetical protein